MIESTEKPKRKRRWLRFSLRTCLIVVTVFSAWIGWYVYRAEKQRTLVQWVRENGGMVQYDYEYDGEYSVIDDSQRSVPKWLFDMLGVDFFSSVTLVAVFNAQVSDVAPFATLKNLKSLYLDETQVSDITPLASLTNLEILHLSDTQVSDVKPLAGLTNLKYLRLDDTQVSDVIPLAGLTNLEILYLPDTRVSDVTPLAGLTNLETLSLFGTQVSDKQFAKLQKALPNCKILHD